MIKQVVEELSNKTILDELLISSGDLYGWECW